MTKTPDTPSNIARILGGDTCPSCKHSYLTIVRSQTRLSCDTDFTAVSDSHTCALYERDHRDTHKDQWIRTLKLS